MPSHSGSDASVEPSCYNPLSLPSHVMCIVRFHTIGCSTATFDDFVFVVVHCCVSVVVCLFLLLILLMLLINVVSVADVLHIIILLLLLLLLLLL